MNIYAANWKSASTFWKFVILHVVRWDETHSGIWYRYFPFELIVATEPHHCQSQTKYDLSK